MDEYQSLISIISLTLSVSWASVINLYAAMLMLGLAGATGNVDLPTGLETLKNCNALPSFFPAFDYIPAAGQFAV